ncbi:PucR family transcriptional regulator [Pseudomonas sp. 1176_21]|uniref:PucR family transcriptional regulator n=1 Tax=Pseudomonas sp. 1176_21 TaxID=2604453 RepID=UPI004064BC86
MKLATALEQTSLSQATVVAGRQCLDRDLAWVHIVDHPDIFNWLKKGDLLLTTGYNWPQDPQKCRDMVRRLAELGLAGVVMAVPHFHEHFPQAAIEEADRCCFPLLELPWEVAFSDITQQVLEQIINFQTRIIRRSDLIHRMLTRAAIEADNLQSLASALTSALELPALIVASSGSVLGDSEPANDAVELAVMRHLNEQANLLQGVEPQVLELDADAGAFRLGCPIRLQGERVGVVWLKGQRDSFEELHCRAVEHAALIAALQLSHQRELLDQENRLGHALVAGLLEGKFPETPRAIERALVSGWCHTRDYRVCLVLLDEPIPLSREGFQRRKEQAERITEIMQGLGIAPLLSVSLNQISLIVPADVVPESIWKHIRLDGGAMAASRVHRGVAGMAQGAGDVATLLPLLRPGKLHGFDEVLFPRALMGDDDARRMLLERLVTPLTRHKNGAMLMETLCTLASEGFQLASSARCLDIHISTLRYRVERIEELLQLSMENPQARFQLQVATEMYRLQNDA